MKVRIKRFDTELPLPEYKTSGAAAFDLTAREEVIIQPHAISYVPLNVAIETPEGYFLLIAARSGTHKRGLMLSNGIGIIDPDYAGDNDEVVAAYFNFTDAPVTVVRGERIAQGTFVKIERGVWHEESAMPNKDRGGFGSTGHK
jgi:dUTP pyrophosphatase